MISTPWGFRAKQKCSYKYSQIQVVELPICKKTYARQIRSSFQVEEKQVTQIFKTPAEIPLENLMD